MLDAMRAAPFAILILGRCHDAAGVIPTDLFRLSFPKIPSGWIRALWENQGIVRRDACHAPSAWDVCRQPVQVAAPAGAR
jgi:hypothetical protein